MPSVRLQKQKRENPALSEEASNHQTMAEALDTRELVATLDGFGAKLTINDLPKELLVSVFEAVGDPIWVRHTVPLVCKSWAELYRTRDASPLQETLEVDFLKELDSARAAAQEPALRRPVVHASKVNSWAERRAGSVRKLRLKGDFSGALEDFSSEDLGTLVAVVGSSLTELRIDWDLYERYKKGKPFWESLRHSVVPAGRMRSFLVKGIFGEAPESDVEPLGQLAGSLEQLVLSPFYYTGVDSCSPGYELLRFTESFFALTELRRLELIGHSRITAIPAKISSLKKLEEITLGCSLSSLPKELGELPRLKYINLAGNMDLGNAHEDEAFPPELGRMKYLRVLVLSYCGLGTVPVFVGELKSLEILDLSYNDLQNDAPLDFLIKGFPRLRQIWLRERPGAPPRTPALLAHLEAFKAKLLAQNPDAEVIY